MESSTRSQFGYWLVVIVTAVSIIGSSLALSRLELSMPIRLSIAVIPVICCGLMMYLLINMERARDEMLKRIQFEALAWAFPIAFVAIIALGSITKALRVTPFDILDSAIVMVLAYCIGYVIAHKRYS